MSPPLRVVYDGWALCRHPGSPAALHLLAMLENIPSDLQPMVAVPEAPPDWFPQVPFQILETPIQNHLNWEQSSLPRLALRLDAQLLHLFYPYAPLIGSSPTVISPCNFDQNGLPAPDHGKQSRNLRERLHQSIRLGGLARAQVIFWPDDLATNDSPVIFHNLPPLVYSHFTTTTHATNEKRQDGSEQAWNELRQLNLPETYLLYHGPASMPAIQRLLSAWQWAAGPIGDYHPLLVVGFTVHEQDLFMELAKPYGFGKTIMVLPELSPQAIAILYHGCSALVHPAPEPPWGGPIRHALACGKPVVASHYPQTSRLVGSAAYLAPENDHRTQGAALITVVVEEDVAITLAQAARQCATAWTGAAYSRALSAAYQRVLARHTNEF